MRQAKSETADLEAVFRAPVTPELKEQLAALTTKVEEADAGIRAAARPQKLHFEIVAVQ